MWSINVTNSSLEVRLVWVGLYSWQPATLPMTVVNMSWKWLWPLQHVLLASQLTSIPKRAHRFFSYDQQEIQGKWTFPQTLGMKQVRFKPTRVLLPFARDCFGNGFVSPFWPERWKGLSWKRVGPFPPSLQERDRQSTASLPPYLRTRCDVRLWVPWVSRRKSQGRHRGTAQKPGFTLISPGTAKLCCLVRALSSASRGLTVY